MTPIDVAVDPEQSLPPAGTAYTEEASVVPDIAGNGDPVPIGDPDEDEGYGDDEDDDDDEEDEDEEDEEPLQCASLALRRGGPTVRTRAPVAAKRPDPAGRAPGQARCASSAMPTASGRHAPMHAAASTSVGQ